VTASGRIRVWAARPVAPTMALTAQQALWFELMPFYIREAWLLDERKLNDWLDLFTDGRPKVVTGMGSVIPGGRGDMIASLIASLRKL